MEKKKEGADQGGLIYQNLRKLINIVVREIILKINMLG
jgi:hypothetical protein